MADVLLGPPYRSERIFQSLDRLVDVRNPLLLGDELSEELEFI